MKFTTQKLDNGLTVVTDQIPDAKIASIHWVLRVGSRQDTIPGTAHFFEHLFSSSPAWNGQEACDRFNDISPGSNFTTGLNSINAFAYVAPDYTEEVITTIGDAVSKPQWTPHIFRREKNRILSEHDLDLSNGDWQLYGEARKLAYRGHALANSILGSRENIAAMTEEDCLSYRSRWFGSNMMALCVSGPLPHEDVLALAERSFGALQPRDAVEYVKPQFNAHQSSAVVMPMPMQVLAMTYESHPAHSLDQVAGRTMMALLWRSLKKVFNEAGAYTTPGCNDFMFPDCGQYQIKHETHPEKTNDALRMIKQVIDDPANWLTEEDLNRSVRLGRASVAKTFLDPQDRTGSLADKFALTGRIDSYESLIDDFYRVTFDDVRNAYDKLNRNAFNVTGFGPVASLPKPSDL